MRPFKLLVSLALALAPVMVEAQQGATISGRVIGEGGAPVRGAQVFLEGMALGAQTNDDGVYSFGVPAARANGQTVRLTARLIGFTAGSATIVLTPGPITRNFTLGANPLRLDEVVVTGAGTSTQANKLGNVRNNVDSTVLVKSNETNLVNALAGKAPNVEVSSQSGEAGASSYIRIRGSKTINGTGQPLFVVDGSPIDNSTISTGPATESTAASNRASDINPNDIESVEILKGAAAAAIYGARAGQGVILITTKGGRAGPTRYSLRTSVTADKVNSDYPLQTTFGQGSRGRAAVCAADGCRLTSLSYGAKLAEGTPIFDHFGELFRTGSTVDNTLTISGGNDRTLFYLSGGRVDQKGIIIGPNNYYDRTTFRLKGSHRLTDRFTVGGNVAYVDDRGSFIQKGSNLSGLLLGGLRTPPEFNNAAFTDTLFGLHRSYRYPRPTATSESNPVGRGYDNPFFVVNRFQNTTQVGRTYGNATVDYRALDWLNFKYTLGGDYYADERLEGIPLTATNFNGGIGAVKRVDFVNLQLDHNLLGTGRWDISPNFATSLTLGQNLNSRNFKQLYAEGAGLIAPQPFQLDNTIAANLQTDEFESLIHTQSYFAQSTFDLWNQLFLTAAIRNDGSSTFGKSKPRHWFPKASIAWNFTEKLKFGDILPTGKLRLAYGESGQEPTVYSTLTGLTTGAFAEGYVDDGLSTTQNGIGGLITSTIKAQPNLGPERSKEIEGGFDIALFRNFADMSFTAYRSRTEDVILFTPVAPSTGYLSQSQNAGRISNTGVEVSLNMRPLTRPNFGWDIGLQYARNNNKVNDLFGFESVDLNTGGYFTGAAGAAVKGSRVGVLRGQDFARCGRGVKLDDGTDIDALCGAGAAKNALFIGANGFPVVDPLVRVIADGNPDWTGSVRSSMTIARKLVFSGLLDIKEGGDNWNGTKGALYNFGKHKDTEVRDVERTFGKDFMPARPGASGAVAGPGAGKPVTIDQNWYQGDGSGFGSVSAQFIEDASYAKLRELSVTYTIGGDDRSRPFGFSSIDLRLAGRNLKTWTKYSGVDPETNLGGAEVAVRGIDYFNNPQSKSFVFSIGLNR
ncbi:MAG TPA: SusC/RagA family TonB-linked outer membrane protein [Gemmatimonadaceae bacterium]|nr:SusC/RagA family TonB-linked outer membrane protein [Gemmatimonadaceae bacterium]